MASKKASDSSPVTLPMASASAGEVRGPVARMTLSQSSGGRPATSSRRSSTSGWASNASCTAAEKPCRSTASAPPAGSLWASAAFMISEPARRISSWITPTALLAASSERKELEHTSSARFSVRCASVPRTGRISCSVTGTPAEASCHAASLPASPPPTIWTGRKFCAGLMLDVMYPDLKPCASLHGGAANGHQVSQSADRIVQGQLQLGRRDTRGRTPAVRFGPGRRQCEGQAAGWHRQAVRAGLEEHRPGPEGRRHDLQGHRQDDDLPDRQPIHSGVARRPRQGPAGGTVSFVHPADRSEEHT